MSAYPKPNFKYQPEITIITSQEQIDQWHREEQEIASEALKILGEGQAELATKFKNSSQLDALRLLGKEQAELAVQFEYKSQFWALEGLGKEHALIALRFTLYAWEALRVLGVSLDNVELALKFEHMYQMQALWYMGKEHYQIALQITGNSNEFDTISDFDRVATARKIAEGHGSQVFEKIKCIEQIDALAYEGLIGKRDVGTRDESVYVTRLERIEEIIGSTPCPLEHDRDILGVTEL